MYLSAKIVSRRFSSILLTALLALPNVASAQYAASAAKNQPAARNASAPVEPANPQPKATDFRDPIYKLSFHVPAGWNFEKQDGVLSNFGADVRTSKRNLNVRGVAALNYNPYPLTTFSGASFYYSVLPKSDAAGCAAQATTAPLKPQKDAVIASKPFRHGEDIHGVLCTESRDEVYTALKGNSCLRFDLVINTFCAKSSGAMELSPTQLSDLNTRMTKILDTIHID
jgi:hypothetical protein